MIAKNLSGMNQYWPSICPGKKDQSWFGTGTEGRSQKSKEGKKKNQKRKVGREKKKGKKREEEEREKE